MERIVGAAFNHPSVVMIGNFDGVHRGHQALIRRGRELAEKSGWAVVALTFDPHPASVLKPVPPEHYLITPTDVKLHWFERFGVDYVKVLRFDHALAAVPAFPFLALEVKAALNAQAVVVGFNFTFGAGGAGHAETLLEWGRMAGVAVDIVSPVEFGEGVVSSSAIRHDILKSRIGDANQRLGHPFAVQGVVQKGEGRGSTIGIPTLNLSPPVCQVMPEYGVYAGFLREGDTVWAAVANWGVRPTFGQSVPVLEVHVIDGQLPDWHGRSVTFDFTDRVRPEKKFDSVDTLVAQIRQDVEKARQLLS